jgi:hypothetical protein
MRECARVASVVAVVVGAVGVFAFMAIPGCFRQNQDNSPISINNSQGRLALSVTCNTDGSVAYVTDGRNVYRYVRNVPGGDGAWECILSQGQRLELAVQYDPREPPPADDVQKAHKGKANEGKRTDGNDAATKS